MGTNKFKNADMDDVLENPSAFGAPTFEEFRRNPEKWMGRDDDSFSEVERGSELLKSNVQRHIFEIEGYRCKTLEEVERVASSQGIPLRELDYRPQMIPQGAGKWDILVRFVSRNERKRRNGVKDAFREVG